MCLPIMGLVILKQKQNCVNCQTPQYHYYNDNHKVRKTCKQRNVNGKVFMIEHKFK